MTPRGGLGRASLLLIALASGCVTPAVDPALPDIDSKALGAERDAAAAAFDTFRVRGGLGIWNDERSVTARVDWRQRGDALDIGLVAPLGLGSARLVRVDGRTSLTRGDAPPITGSSADEVLQRALELPVPVPLDQLAAWLRGLPGDGHDVRRDRAGRLESLRWRDAGGVTWQARVLDWTRLDGLELPALVTARGAGYRLRLVLRDWMADVRADSPDDDGELAPGPVRRQLPGAAPVEAPKRRAIPRR